MSIAARLKKMELFRDLDPADIESLLERMPRLTFFGGDVLFNGGDVGDTMYIILNGQVRIYTYDKEGQEVKLIHYRAGDSFGELALIDAYPRSASAMATEPLEVLALTREVFLKFLVEHPQFGLTMMRNLSQRLRNTTNYLERYRPARFATAPVEEGKEFRREASGMLVEILDKVDSDESSSDLLPFFEKAFSEEGMTQLDTEDVPDLGDLEGKGIFDRIIAAMEGQPTFTETVHEDDTHEEPD